MAKRFQAIVLDLFDTLVRWDPKRLPAMEIDGRTIHSTVPWLLPIVEAAVGPRFVAADFIAAYRAVLRAIDEERAASAVEITCHERFERTLARLGVPVGNGASALAETLTRKHMEGVRAVTAAPAEYKAVVRRLAGAYRLGVLSNFDDARTGHEIVVDTGLRDLFAVVMISAEVAVRKPNPKIFRRLLDDLGLEPARVLFVGDTFREDVVGAQRAGIPVAWLSQGKPPMPEGATPPDFVLPDLTALPTILDLD